MEIKIDNFTLSSDRAESSYGIPVLVSSSGKAHGPEDRFPLDSPLEFIEYRADRYVLDFYLENLGALSEDQKALIEKFIKNI